MIRKLTDELVERMSGSPRRQQTFVWDRDTAGLGLRITRQGKRSWVFRYSLGGRDRRMTLGGYHAMDLTAARQRVAELREQVDRGEDPASAKQDATDQPTLLDLWQKLERDYLPRRSIGHQRNLRDAWERLILPKLGGSAPLTELTWEDVDTWHQSLRGTPAMGNRSLAALSVALNMARRWDMIARGTPNVASDHERHREGVPRRDRPKARPLTAVELAAVGAALEAEPDPVQRVALTVFMLSGLRPGEVCRLRWGDLGEGGVTYLGQTKTGPRHAVLSTRAEELIRELPKAGGWVFPSSRNRGEPLGGAESDDHGLGESWKRVRAHTEMTLPPVYSGRHNWISTAAAEGIGDDVRRLLAGHVSSGNGAHGDYLHVTEALRPIADQVAEKIAAGLGLGR